MTDRTEASSFKELSDPRRLRALEKSGLMDSSPEEVFDRAVRLATQITGRPVALLSLVDDTRQFFKAQTGLPADVAEARGTPLSHSFCKHVVATQGELVVDNAHEDERVAGNGAIEDINVSAYLGVPVRDDEGEVLGSLCVIDTEPHEWTKEERRALADLRAMIETDLSLRSVMRSKELLLNEFDHRIRNLFSVMIGITRMTARAATDVDALSQTLTARLSAMDTAQKLVSPRGSGLMDNDGQVTLSELAQTVLVPYDSDAITIGDIHVTAGRDAATAFALILHELATNAVKYGALSKPGGKLSVDWRIDDNTLIFTWCERMAGIGQDRSPQPDGLGQGFGTTLLKINIEQELSGTQERVFLADEMRIVLRIPVNALEN